MKKKLFKKQMMVIAISIIVMIMIGIGCKELTTKGLGSLFTIKAYKEAFEVQAFDIFMIKLLATGAELMALAFCYIELQYNKEIDDIEKEEELFMKGVMENGR
jgi:hypothetical protein